MTPNPVQVAAADWLPTVVAKSAEGFTYLDLLTAVDRPAAEQFEIVLRLVRLGDAQDHADAWLRTSIDRAAPAIDSLTGVLPAASWHEREIHEMFGIDFAGHPDLRPLLLATGHGMHPLRKETPLVARVETPWPGAAGQETGRRTRRASLPPGVPAAWVREES